MKHAIRLFTILAFLGGCFGLLRLSFENSRLGEAINQLEAELGRMSIDEADRVHIVEIEVPDVPPEVAPYVERVWQFRCYLPPNYDFVQLSGGGRVAEEGVYQEGGSGSSWSSPKPEAIHKLLTVSFQKERETAGDVYFIWRVWGTGTWGHFNPDRFDDTLVVQKLVSSAQGPRSFDQKTILPMLKIYDPSTAETKQLGSDTLTTYAGGLIVLCPKSRDPELNQLRTGKTPIGFEPSWIATEAGR